MNAANSHRASPSASAFSKFQQLLGGSLLDKQQLLLSIYNYIKSARLFFRFKLSDA